jgi:hypothetical protein
MKARAREWWIPLTRTSPSEINSSTPFMAFDCLEEAEKVRTYENTKPAIAHVIAARPDTIQISRKELKQELGLAMGFGSVAWSELPSGVFDSDACVKYGDERLEKLFGQEKK